MISPVTCVSMILFAGSGLYLYQAKHQAEVETREIRRLVGEADAIRQHAGVLATEYQLENDPELLGKLAAHFLPQLKPTQPPQFTTLADLDSRLPPVGLPPAAAEPQTSDLVYAFPPAPAAGTGGGASSAAISAADASSRAKAASAIAARAAVAGAAATGAAVATASTGVGVGAAASSGRPVGATSGGGAHVSTVASTTPANAASAYAMPYATLPYAATPYAAGGQGGGGSALGMARTMSPHPYAPPAQMVPFWAGGSGG